MNWQKVKSNSATQYMSKDKEIVLTVIKTGFEDNYILVFDSPFEEVEVTTYRLTRAELKEQFKISLTDEKQYKNMQGDRKTLL